MTTYNSSEKQINKSSSTVFEQISDLKKLDLFKDKLADIQGINNFEITEETVSFDTDMFGKISVQLAEKTPYSSVKYTLKSALKDADIQINVRHISENESALQVSLLADIPAMFKMMIGSKLSEGMEKVADGVAKALNATR